MRTAGLVSEILCTGDLSRYKGRYPPPCFGNSCELFHCLTRL